MQTTKESKWQFAASHQGQMKVADLLTNLLMPASILTHLSHFLIVEQSSVKGAFYHTCI